MDDTARLTFLGTGTSQGVPIIGCGCPVCSSSDGRDKRLRSSAFVRWRGVDILIDAGPDFRMQLLREGIAHVDAILLTHNHRDHTGGLDDTRSLNYIDRRATEIYCERGVLDDLKAEYPYAFESPKYPGAPEWKMHLIDDRPFTVPPDNGQELVWTHDVGYAFRQSDGSLAPSGDYLCPTDHDTGRGGADVIPIRGYHDQMPVLGFRFGQIAYITDMSRIAESEFAKLEGLKHLTLNTVGYRKHHSHFSLDEALELAGRIGARHTWLTHLSHTFPVHGRFCEELRRLCDERHIDSDVQPAYDGLTID